LLRPPLVRLIGLRVWALPQKKTGSRGRGDARTISTFDVSFSFFGASGRACSIGGGDRKGRSKRTIQYCTSTMFRVTLAWGGHP
jgi:hypothetical protein